MKISAKRLICVVLALVLTLSLAACGSKTKTPAQTNVPAEGGSSGSDNNAPADSAEIPVVKIALPSISEPTHLEAVTDAMNEILVEKTGCKVEFVILDYGTYANQMNMILSSGENAVDAFHTLYSFTLSSLVANGQVMALDDLLANYGQGIIEAVGQEYLNCGKVNGEIYTLPIVAAYSNATGYILSKEVADEFGATDENINNLEDLTELLLKVKEKYPEYNLVPTSTAGWMLDCSIDNLCDTNNLGVLMDYGQNLTVENYYASEHYRELCEYAKIWQDAGMMTDDPLNNSNGTMAEINAGTALGTFSDRPSAEANIMDYQPMLQIEITAFQLCDALATTQNVIHSNWCIPSSCKDPESTMKVLNEFYSNPELSTIALQGIEGLTYELNENGQAVYPEGVDMMNAGWGMNMTFLWLNPAIAVPMVPQTTEYWQGIVKSNETCLKSKALGFTFDASNVSDEMTACVNVVNQYHLPLMAGIVDYEEVLPQFLSALEDAGIDKIIAEKQAQLDAWAAQQ